MAKNDLICGRITTERDTSGVWMLLETAHRFFSRREIQLRSFFWENLAGGWERERDQVRRRVGILQSRLKNKIKNNKIKIIVR